MIENIFGVEKWQSRVLLLLGVLSWTVGDWCTRQCWLKLSLCANFTLYIFLFFNWISVPSFKSVSHLFFKSLSLKCSVVVCCSAWSVPLVFGINGFCFNQPCLEFSSSPPEWLLFFQRPSVFSFPGTMTSLLRLNSINFVNGHTWDLGPGVKARITQASGEKYAPKGISTKVCINQRFKAWKGKRSKNIQIMLQISWHCVFTIMFAVA